jgi:hypothetical protein
MNELQEILPPQIKVDSGPPSISTSALTPHGKITAYFIGRAVRIAASIGFFVAMAATYYFRERLGFGVFGPIGFGVMVWAIATVVITSAFDFVTYLVLKRRLAEVLPYHSHRDT